MLGSYALRGLEDKRMRRLEDKRMKDAWKGNGIFGILGILKSTGGLLMLQWRFFK
jgi:hypothetical protein